MSNSKPLNITTPVGRLVGGSLYEPRTTDYDGKPLVVKNGANAGQPRVEFSFGVAIPKSPGVTHWASEPWGAPIWALAHAAFPAGEAQRHDFAWKITDGDSAVPNKKGVKPNSREGFPGHWVIWFSSGTAPRVYNADGTQLILEKDAVKPGYYVQVFGNVKDNKPSQSPGLYVNHSMVAFAAYGQEISIGPDVSQAGFGQGAALPPGAMSAPPAGAIPATGATPPAPPAAPGAAANVPPPPAPPGAVAAPPAAPARQMTAKAAGQTYEALIGAGWTDALLIEHGMMLAPVAASIMPPPLPVGSATPPAPPVGSATPPAPPASTAVAPPPAPVTPNADMRGVPTPPGAAVAPPPPAARQMTAAANGQTYEAMIGAGWTDALLIQHGMMLA